MASLLVRELKNLAKLDVKKVGVKTAEDMFEKNLSHYGAGFAKQMRKSLVYSAEEGFRIGKKSIPEMLNLVKEGSIHELFNIIKLSKKDISKELKTFLINEAKLYPAYHVREMKHLAMTLEKQLGSKAFKRATADSVVNEVKKNPQGLVVGILEQILKHEGKIILTGVILVPTIMGVIDYIKKTQVAFNGCLVYYKQDGKSDLQLCTIQELSCNNLFDVEGNVKIPACTSKEIPPELLFKKKTSTDCQNKENCAEACQLIARTPPSDKYVVCNNLSFWETAAHMISSEANDLAEKISTLTDGTTTAFAASSKYMGVIGYWIYIIVITIVMIVIGVTIKKLSN